MNKLEEACKNIKSGKYFLFIEETKNEETNADELRLVTPTGEVKSLDPSLFEDIEEVSFADLVNNGLITQQQICGYKKFVEEDSIRLWEEIMRSVEDVEDRLERLRIAEERMSEEQYRFALSRWLERLRKRTRPPESHQD